MNSSSPGYTPIMYATRSNPNIKVIKILLKNGASQDINKTAFLAMKHNNSENFKIIFDALTPELKKDILGGKIKDTSGLTLLGLAAKVNNSEAVKFLVDSGADVDAQNIDGRTALMETASSYSSPKVLKILLDSGADANISLNRNST